MKLCERLLEYGNAALPGGTRRPPRICRFYIFDDGTGLGNTLACPSPLACIALPATRPFWGPWPAQKLVWSSGLDHALIVGWRRLASKPDHPRAAATERERV